MALMVRVCADLYADKVNLEIICDRAWDMDRVRDTIAGVMNAEAELMRPPTAPRIPFHLHRLQMFDDRVLSWVDVAAAEQFFEGAQLYAFQPQTSYHTDVQKGLPPSRPPSARAAPAPMAQQAPVQVQVAAVPVAPAAAPAGVLADGVAVYENGRDGATEEEKVNYLFDEMDAGEQGHLSYAEFSSWLRELVDFSEETFQLLFRSADAHGQGVVSRELFLHFSRRFPNVCEIVFHRAADRWDVTNRDMEARAASQQLKAGAAQEKDIERQMEALQEQLAQLQAQLGGVRGDNEELARTIQVNGELNKSVAHRRANMHAEEQGLMEKEILMERNREALRDSEALFLEQSQRYDKAASALGSPRRSRYYSNGRG